MCTDPQPKRPRVSTSPLTGGTAGASADRLASAQEVPSALDHTRSHVVADGETLSSVAWDYLDDPTRWRHLADSNAIDDPRRIAVGSSLVVPAILPAGVS